MNHELLPLVKHDLEMYGITYHVVSCDADFSDTQSFCEKYGYRLDQSANTILVIDRKDASNIVACLLLANTKLDVNKKVCALMGTKRASFATKDQTVDKSNMEIGGVTIFGLPNNMPIYIDSEVMDTAEIILGGGNRTSKVILNPIELNKLPNVQVIRNLSLSK